MAKRTGPSISVKMILTSTLLILLIVVGFGFLSLRDIARVYDTTAKQRIDDFRQALTRQGRSNTVTFAKNLLLPLRENQDDEIPGIVTRTAEPDPQMKVLYVLTGHKQVVAYCRVVQEGNEVCANPTYRRSEFGELPAVREESWKKIEQVWKQRNEQGDTRLLAQVELRQPGGHVAYFAYPVFSEEATPTPADALATRRPANRWGYVVVGYDLTPIELFARESERQKQSASYYTALRHGAFGGLFVIIGSVLAVFQGLSISKPIKVLAWKVDQIARGDLQARVEVKSTDEIGMLGESFNFMADQVMLLLKETAERANLAKELEVARTIQDTLVPSNEPVDCGYLRFAGYFQPAAQCGGDWWTYHRLAAGKLLLVIGDVTGHGVSSAMITATAKSACDVARWVHTNDVAVTTLLEIMNDAIYQSAKRKFVMTCFASVIDPRSRTITYANAGHNFPYLYRQTSKHGEFGSLMIRGNRLGDLRESHYEAKTTELLPGDTLVWYTDGVVECESEVGEEYGEKRFRDSIRRAAALDAGELRDNVVNDAMKFFGNMPRKDDITMIVGRVT